MGHKFDGLIAKIGRLFAGHPQVILKKVYDELKRDGSLKFLDRDEVSPSLNLFIFRNTSGSLVIQVSSGIKIPMRGDTLEKNALSYRIVLKSGEVFRLIFVGSELNSIEFGDRDGAREYFIRFENFAELDKYFAEKIRLAVCSAESESQA